MELEQAAFLILDQSGKGKATAKLRSLFAGLYIPQGDQHVPLQHGFHAGRVHLFPDGQYLPKDLFPLGQGNILALHFQIRHPF